MSSAALLQVQQMQLGLADGTPLVDGVSWSLQPGQTLAVVGGGHAHDLARRRLEPAAGHRCAGP